MLGRGPGVAAEVAAVGLVIITAGVAAAGVAFRTGAALGIDRRSDCAVEFAGTLTTTDVVVGLCLPELHGALHANSKSVQAIRAIVLSLAATLHRAG